MGKERLEEDYDNNYMKKAKLCHQFINKAWLFEENML